MPWACAAINLPGGKMPINGANSIKKLIYYQYAKHIARGILHVHDTESAKKHFGLIMAKFKELENGTIHWSDITREDKQFTQSEKECIYCGKSDDLSWEHIVPKSLHINGRCPTCPKIMEIHNLVWACRSCNSAKGKTGLYKYYKKITKENGNYFDIIPPLLEKKYLKTIYYCHECAWTLDKTLDPKNEDSYLEPDFEV